MILFFAKLVHGEARGVRVVVTVRDHAVRAVGLAHDAQVAAGGVRGVAAVLQHGGVGAGARVAPRRAAADEGRRRAAGSRHKARVTSAFASTRLREGRRHAIETGRRR